MPFDISLPEMLIILLAVLLIFGPKRLPEMGRSLGRGLRQFRESVSGIDSMLTTSEPDTAEQTKRVASSDERHPLD
ncbi:MAG TPA: twin-arginine translocase TatA/TatE family subunit [Gaiellaceae bacterium]|nr:twin-arginine translocase TatA/TatE family subunit [Gaiellaceae bacterium]